MTIDPKTLPDGVVAEVDHGNRIEPRYLYDGGTRVHPDASTVPLGGRFVTRVFVPVPDGVAYDDALRALEDARPWAPLPDGPTDAHVGKRLRCAWSAASHVEDKVHHVSDNGAHFWGIPGSWDITSGDWFIHPDDVPDPDADLIERMAEALRTSDATDWSGYARAALAVIREDGAR